ncbi:MAG: methionyl-tRNA formyltransferase [Planctomycetes bacterium]|nr:methionyl-tRNA formyltransferase [Planctomycetota bacterium]
MRLIYFGSGAFGLPTLKALCEAHHLALIITQPDRPAGRNRQLTPTPVAAWAQERGMRILKPERVNRPEILEEVRGIEADANVVVAFGQKIGVSLIESPRHGPEATMNLHASLLPKYRGAAPINWAMMQGEHITGNTVFSLVEEMDAGDILGMQQTLIDPMETAGELHDRLSEMGPKLVLEVLDNLHKGCLEPRAQDVSQVTLAPKLGKADTVMDFSLSAELARCRVHGLTPWPGVRCWFGQDRKLLLLRRVQDLPEVRHNKTPGTLIDEGTVATGSGAIKLLEVQPAGKRIMNWSEFARGQALKIGDRFDSHES